MQHNFYHMDVHIVFKILFVEMFGVCLGWANETSLRSEMSVKRALYSLSFFSVLNVAFSSACLLLSGKHADVVADFWVCLYIVKLFVCFSFILNY